LRGSFFFETTTQITDQNDLGMINIDDRLLEQCDESEFKLLCHIAKRVGEDKTAFPSNATLCADTGWHIDKMRLVKKRLVKKGFLKEEPRLDEHGRQTSNLITIVTPFLSVYVNLSGAGGVEAAENQVPNTSEIPTENPDTLRIFHTGGGAGKSTPTPYVKSTPTPLRKIHTLSIKQKEVLTSEVLTPSPPASEAAEPENFEAEIFEEKKFCGGPETSLAAEQRKAIEGCQAWCDENPEQVRWWRDTARFRGDIGPVIAGFFSHWWGERDKNHQCRTAPTDFFQTRFLKWLQTEERMQQTQTGYANNGPTHRSGGAPTRKPARANGAEDAFNPAAVAAVLRERHGVDVGFGGG